MGAVSRNKGGGAGGVDAHAGPLEAKGVRSAPALVGCPVACRRATPITWCALPGCPAALMQHRAAQLDRAETAAAAAVARAADPPQAHLSEQDLSGRGHGCAAARSCSPQTCSPRRRLWPRASRLPALALRAPGSRPPPAPQATLCLETGRDRTIWTSLGMPGRCPRLLGALTLTSKPPGAASGSGQTSSRRRVWGSSTSASAGDRRKCCASCRSTSCRRRPIADRPRLGAWRLLTGAGRCSAAARTSPGPPAPERARALRGTRLSEGRKVDVASARRSLRVVQPRAVPALQGRALLQRGLLHG